MKISDIGRSWEQPKRWLAMANSSIFGTAPHTAAGGMLDPAAFLDEHSRSLQRSRQAAKAFLAERRGLLDARPDLQWLSQLAAEIALLLQPASPDPIFREQLKSALLDAHRKGEIDVSLLGPAEDGRFWPWPVVASVPVALGIAAIVWRYTQRVDEQPVEAA